MTKFVPIQFAVSRINWIMHTCQFIKKWLLIGCIFACVLHFPTFFNHVRSDMQSHWSHACLLLCLPWHILGICSMGYYMRKFFYYLVIIRQTGIFIRIWNQYSDCLLQYSLLFDTFTIESNIYQLYWSNIITINHITKFYGVAHYSLIVYQCQY